jgi:hypothetical protein
VVGVVVAAVVGAVVAAVVVARVVVVCGARVESSLQRHSLQPLADSVQ